jgi:coenzyme F420 hydrogenase subunit delta
VEVFEKGRRMESEWYGKRTLILGCGNWLLGDDGFGPSVVERLKRDVTVPPDVYVLDAGTSVREILFDVTLSEEKPEKIVIVDAIDCDREPGELFALDIGSMPQKKLADFSSHQVPTSSLLRDLRDLCGVDVIVMVCQVLNRDTEIGPGLSQPVEQAVRRAVETLIREHIE